VCLVLEEHLPQPTTGNRRPLLAGRAPCFSLAHIITPLDRRQIKPRANRQARACDTVSTLTHVEVDRTAEPFGCFRATTLDSLTVNQCGYLGTGFSVALVASLALQSPGAAKGASGTLSVARHMHARV
jgi:hypothetical protein